jgi:hypothetical protein
LVGRLPFIVYPVSSRILLAGLVVAVAVGVGGWLLGYKKTYSVKVDQFGNGTYQAHPGWANYLAAGVLVIGAMTAAGIVLSPRFAERS